MQKSEEKDMKKFTFGLKKVAALALAAGLTTLSVTGCGAGATASASSAANEKKDLVYAKGVGPYTELFEEAIIPILEKKGYTFKVTELDLNQADAAITAGNADVSVEQHSAFM